MRTEEIYSAEHLAYVAMLDRCLNPRNPASQNYRRKGVTVCDRWMPPTDNKWTTPTGYINFLADMGRKPSPDHRLRRIDLYKDFSPQNCEWAPPRRAK